MDIQKERAEFEKWYIQRCPNTDLTCDGRDGYWHERVQVAFDAWQAAKAGAVPDGYVVVPKELPEHIAEKMAIDRIDKPRHENDPVWNEIAEESYKGQVKLKKWEFWRDYKAMIKAAQEQDQ